MAFYNEYPHTRNYNDDLRELIHLYKDLGKEYETLVQIYEIVKQDIKDITIEQLQQWLYDGTLENLINTTLLTNYEYMYKYFFKKYNTTGNIVNDIINALNEVDYLIFDYDITIPDNVTIPISNKHVKCINNAKFITNNLIFTGNNNVIDINLTFSDVTGLKITGNNNIICGIFNRNEKNTNTAISFSNACIFLSGNNNTVIKSKCFNCQTGIISDGTGNIIDSCEIYDCNTGIIVGQNADENKIQNCYIHDNNISTESGADGILSQRPSYFLDIVNNTIVNSGEHGMYIQSAFSKIQNNTVKQNAKSGIKTASYTDVDPSFTNIYTLIENNLCTENFNNIYIQNTSKYINVVGNNCNNPKDTNNRDIEIVNVSGKNYESSGYIILNSNICQKDIHAKAKYPMQIISNTLNNLICEGISVSDYMQKCLITSNIIHGYVSLSDVNNLIIANNNIYNGILATRKYAVLLDSNFIRLGTNNLDISMYDKISNNEIDCGTSRLLGSATINELEIVNNKLLLDGADPGISNGSAFSSNAVKIIGNTFKYSRSVESFACYIYGDFNLCTNNITINNTLSSDPFKINGTNSIEANNLKS